MVKQGIFRSFCRNNNSSGKKEVPVEKAAHKTGCGAKGV
jgi:hypothetical protein